MYDQIDLAALKTMKHRCRRLNSYLHVAERFRIPIRVSDFLFIGSSSRYANIESTPAQHLTGPEAVTRLGKYIDYVESKQRLWANYLWQRQLPKKIRRALEITV